MHAQRTGTNAHQALSFDHAETHRAHAGAQLAHVPISPAQLEDQLNTWAMQGGEDEKRNEAKQRILEAHCTGANQLKLGWLILSDLPESIGELTNLQILDLYANRLTTLPERIGDLTNLQELNLGSNRLTTLPENVTKLTKLRELNLDGNQLTTLPESVGWLINLQELHLAYNKLTTLSECIGKLTNLHTLDLHANQLTTLPENITKLTNLRKLNLDGNELTTLPESVGWLTNFYTLDLHANQLTALPKYIGKLTKLHTLDLHANQLTTLPKSIGKLTNLHTLDLHSNQLTTLPKCIEKLINLQNLHLAYNKLTTPPEIISKLTGLKKCRITDKTNLLTKKVYSKRIELEEIPLHDPAPSQISQSMPNIGPAELEALPPELNSTLANLKNTASMHGEQLHAVAHAQQGIPNIGPAELEALRALQNLPPELNSTLADLKNTASMHGEQLHAVALAQQGMPNISPAELEALGNLKKLPPDLNRALADLQDIASMHGEQLDTVAQAQQGMVTLSALPEKLAAKPQCAQFYKAALQLLLRGWVMHEAVACQIKNAEPRVWVSGIQTLCDAVPLPGMNVAGFGFATLVNQIDTVRKANKGQLLLNRFNNSKVKFEQVAHNVASSCTKLLESELSALPENNDGQKRIGLGQRLKALYNECEALAQRVNLQVKPLANPQYPAANKADELMNLLLHKLCTQALDEGRAGAIPQAHENNFAERMSDYCVELLLPNASNTLVAGRKLVGQKVVALTPNGSSSQGRASSPPGSISLNTFARAMAAKDAELAKLKQQVKDDASAKDAELAKLKQQVTDVQGNVSAKDTELAKLKQQVTDLQDNMSAMVAKAVAKAMADMQKAEASSTFAETANRNASEAKQQFSILGLSKQSPEQVVHNAGQHVPNQNDNGTEAAQSSIGFQPAMGMGQLPNVVRTLNERVDALSHVVAYIPPMDILNTPLSEPEFGRVVVAYLKEHGRLHSDGTVDWNSKKSNLNNRQLLEQLKDIHNAQNRDGDYMLGIELPALLEKMPNAALLNPWIPRNTRKLHQLLGAKKIGL